MWNRQKVFSKGKVASVTISLIDIRVFLRIVLSSMGVDGSLHEPSYNASLTYYDEGNVQACLNNLNASLDKFPEHAGSNELMNMLKEKLMEL